MEKIGVKKNRKFKQRSVASIVMTLAVIIGYGGYFTHITGCQSRRTGNSIHDPIELPDTSQEQASIEKNSKAVGEVAESIKDSADKIDGETQAVKSAVDTETGAIIGPNLNNINTETKSLRGDSEELKRIQVDLEETKKSLSDEQTKVDRLETAARTSIAEIEALKNENKDLRSKAGELFKEKMAWIGVISVFGIGVSVILAFLTRSMTATMIAIGFVVTLGVSIAASIYMSTIGWVTIAIAGVSVVGVLAYIAYTTFVQNKSVDELVQTGEVAKNYLSQEARDHIFGRGAEPGIADQVQSKETKKLVRKVRSYNKQKRGFDLAPGETQRVRFQRAIEASSYVSDQHQEKPSY